MKNLGTMNGWELWPVEYSRHLAKCGREYTYKHMMGKPGVFEVRTGRKYNLTTTRKGNLFYEQHCHDCGCSWSVDSSG